MEHGLSVFATASHACGADPVLCRDRIDGPDEIVVLARDPAWGHVLRAPVTSAATEIVIDGPLRSPLLRGQILELLCADAEHFTTAYLTVSADRAASTAATVRVSVEPPGGSSSTFPTQNLWLNDTCFQLVATDLPGPAPQPIDPASLRNAVRVVKVDRQRYFIQSFGERPYLMLDRGLRNDDGAITEMVVPDVEDLQVAYLFPQANDGVRIVGATAGTRLASAAASIDLAPVGIPAPAFSDPVAEPTRLTHHPGNIRGVRISLVVRATANDPALPGTSTLPAAGNRPEQAATAGFRRFLLETTVRFPNMAARAGIIPFYSENASDRLNTAGG